MYQSADAAAVTAQKRYFGTLGWNLALLIVAAALSIINYPSSEFAMFQSGVLLASLGLTIYLAVIKPQKDWYTARALAESVKTVTWRYIMRAEPFDVDDQAAKSRFLDNMKKILDANAHASSQHVVLRDHGEISEKMHDTRSLLLEERRRYYIDHRIADQHLWYGRKSQWNKRQSQIWVGVLILVNVVAIFFAIVRIRYPHGEIWPTDVFVAAAASILGWIQTKRFDELLASYSLAAHEISIMKSSCPEMMFEKNFSDFVGDAENAFSREHTQWQARKDVQA